MRSLFTGCGVGNAAVVITGTNGTFTDLLHWISEFGGVPGLDKLALQHALVQQPLVNTRNKRLVLVIDEAQSLAPDVLEELRLF
jgi:hypothetical protein